MKLLPSLFLTATVSLSVLAEDIDSLIIKVPNVFGAFEAKEGKDGRKVIYPKTWVTKEGKDGRLVAYPKGWKTGEGKDGRIVAHPLTWVAIAGRDDRNVAYPLTWIATAGKDGRNVGCPLDGKTLIGKGGRKVVVPNGELLFQKADTVALLYVAKKGMALKEWYNLVLYRFINSDDKSLQKEIVGKQDALVKRLLGAKIFSQEKPPKYLGEIAGQFAPDSIFNEFGLHGSEFAVDSIWNEFGLYGGEFSIHSPFNKFTATPPVIVSGNKIIGYLTVNTLIRGGLTPDTVKRLMK